jgi:hypothetical protein
MPRKFRHLGEAGVAGNDGIFKIGEILINETETADVNK